MCIEAACLFSCTELGQFEVSEEERLRAGCARALVSLGHAQKTLSETASGIPGRNSDS